MANKEAVTTAVSRIKVGDRVHVRSTASSTENIRGVYMPLFLNSIVTYVHPEYLFVVCDNGRYKESYRPTDVRLGWASKSGDPTKDVRFLPYVG